jgi:hypothetical protein
MQANLESLIQNYAETMSGKMAEIASRSKSEEDVRHECNNLIDAFLKKAEIETKGQHEYGLAGGRIDSKYGGVIIEYKDPKGSGKITENPKSPGVKAVVKQLKKRFTDFQSEKKIELERIFAVGCDSNTFVFVRYRGKTVEVEDPQPVTPHTVERLLRALVSLGAKGYSFTPDNLCDHFGGQGHIALEGIARIHKVISTTKSKKAQVFFKQWQILFGEVCGYDVHGQSAKIKKLGEHYCIPKAKPAELLFSVHTYYGILIKLLAAEIVSSFSPLGTSALKKLITAPTSAKLRSELETLEQGGIWSQLGIRNFLEGDLFSWYLDAWDDPLDEAVRSMVTTLNQYDPTTLSVEPAESRDLLKKLYQHLFPKSVRHDLGEYYTPDWLAELVLDELGYDGDPDKRLLDPACGSGTFLVMAVNRVKIWFEEHRHECGFSEDELLRKILSNVIGFDLNPLAVMAARTNYLLAIRDLLRHSGNMELPIYLCDSIMTPKDYSQEGGVTFDYLPLKTAVQTFNIPKDVLQDRTLFAKYSDVLHTCVENDYSEEEFISQLANEGVEAKQESQHKRLYGALAEVKRQDRNGVWTRIIKNAFAPLFIGTVDYVAGNPPWVNWESLPEDYRDTMKGLWIEYGLFTLSGSAGRLGGGKKDLSMLFVYAAVDNYLKPNGRLGFVITQSVFKTQGAGDGFRRFYYRRDEIIWRLKPITVHDMSAMQVFEGATNRTAVFVCQKTKRPFNYPVKYTAWSGVSRVNQDESLDSVRRATTQAKLKAVPVVTDKDTSPWLTAPQNTIPAIQKVLGRSHYKAFEGVNTGGLNGCFWIQVLNERPNGDLVIQNLHDVGKIKVPRVEAVIEPDLVYPMLRGRDVHRWHAEPSCHIILAQDPDLRKGIPETTMKLQYPKTYSYLKKFEGDPKRRKRGTLWGRASSSVRKLMETGAFYSMFAVGPYTMAEWKVVWRKQSSAFQATVVGLSREHIVCPDHKLMLVPCQEYQEAYYLSALLNASPSLMVVKSYVISPSTSTHVLEHVAIPRFDSRLPAHIRLSELSQECHEAAALDAESEVQKLEKEIDELAAELWSITPTELKAIQKALEKS